MPLEPQRALFDLPREVCYLNAAYMTPLPRRFVQIGADALAGSLRPWQVAPRDFFTMTERVRSLAARVMEADTDGVALVPAVSYAVATAARNLALPEGGVILTLAEEFPSNHYGWARLAAERGARLVAIAGPAERDWTSALLDEIARHRSRLALVAIPHVHWSTGSMIDLARIAPVVRDAGAALFLDLTQSLGALPVPLGEIDPDFAVAAGYKWLFGPYALGYMYVAPRHRDGIPLEENWINRAGSEDFTQLVDYADAYQPGARRFDMGERTNFQLMPLAEAALELVLGWGIDAIADSLRALNRRLAARLADAGYICTPQAHRAPHMMAARHPDRSARDTAEHWRRQGVITSARGEWVRIAPHLWIDEEDEARFAQALASP